MSHNEREPLLSPVLLKISKPDNTSSVTVRAVLDNVSQLNFIRESVIPTGDSVPSGVVEQLHSWSSIMIFFSVVFELLQDGV